MFEAVYTFEPETLNFAALVHNACAANVYKFQCGLGNKARTAAVTLAPDELCNVGAYQMFGVGRVPVIPLDALGLADVDFLQLDVEGMEYDAILGARETIKRCRPVIMVEDKGLSAKYGVKQGAVLALLEDGIGYRIEDHVGRDFILCSR